MDIKDATLEQLVEELKNRPFCLEAIDDLRIWAQYQGWQPPADRDALARWKKSTGAGVTA